MDWISLGWRDILLLLVVLAAVYLAVMLFRLTRIGKRPARPRAEPEETEVPVIEEFLATQFSRQAPQWEASPIVPAESSPVFDEPAIERRPAESYTPAQPPNFEWDDVRELFGDEAAAADRTPAAEEEAQPRRGGFGEALSAHLARSDVETEMQRMRDEMERMRAEMEELRAARRVSPQYAEAMELAQRGLSAQDVADQLGISLAEAELVHALSRSQHDFDEGEGHGRN
jgi:hypothetical protein